MLTVYVMLALVYVAGWYITGAGTYAFYRGEFPVLDRVIDHRMNRAFSAGIGLIPVIPWVIIPFLTGFYVHGLEWHWLEAPPLHD
jgi:hypothetical protein